MKIKHAFTIIVCLLMTVNADAQIFKKIKKRAEQAAERTILRKTDEKVSKTTEKVIDSTTTGKRKQDDSNQTQEEELSGEEKAAAEKSIMSMFGGGLEELPDTYKFQYVMDMEMTTNKDVMLMQYYIQPDVSYFGNAITDKNTTSVTVYDMENQYLVTFMNNGEQKMAMKTRMPFDADAQKEMAKSDRKQEDLTIIPLPDKTILGYKCKGYQIEQKEGISKLYITNEAPVSFVGVFSSMEQMPKTGYGSTVPFDENSMIMEMEYTSNKRKRDNMHMICTKFEERPITIRKEDYKSGM
ncbi:MAG: DUF4412 domain-containing protein [Aquaticitalea sp.]